MSAEPLLDVQELEVRIRTGAGEVRPVAGVSFTVGRGEIVGVVGESGSGKTLTSLAVGALLPRNATAHAARLRFAGCDLLSASPRTLRRLLGTELAMVFQDPMSSLNPSRRIGAQMVEAVREHRGLSREEARRRAAGALADVRLTDPAARLRQYPHELSGGMRQRTMIAMGLMSEPSLIVADEPTTALDVTVQAQVVELLCELNERHGSAVLFISHNIALLSEVCDRILVMYRGRLVEDLTVAELLARPRHPYTRALVGAVPDLRTDRTRELATVPDDVDRLDREVADA